MSDSDSEDDEVFLAGWISFEVVACEGTDVKETIEWAILCVIDNPIPLPFGEIEEISIKQKSKNRYSCDVIISVDECLVKSLQETLEKKFENVKCFFAKPGHNIKGAE